MQLPNGPSASTRHDRVRQHTAPDINERIDRLTRATVEDVTKQGRDAMVRRIADLDHEWDVDRAMMVNFAVLGGVTFGAGLYRFATSRWPRKRPKGLLVFFSAQLLFLLEHGLTGWCPPASMFRRLGFRTAREIEAERRALLRAIEPARTAGGERP
jgi:hypothetical protein